MEVHRQNARSQYRIFAGAVTTRDFRVQIDGSPYKISVEQTGTRTFRVTVDGTVFETEVALNDDITKWLVTSGTERIHAQARKLSNDRVDVWLGCLPFQGIVQTLSTAGYGPVSEMKGKSTFGGQIKALMPGRITSVLVREGEEVREGTSVLILEAMKMQNEITAPVAGKVKTIFVHEGESVKKDAILALID